MRHLSLILAALASAAAAALLWFWFDRPVPVAESWSGPVSSVSFAPFRKGQSPLTKVYPTPEQVAEDLASLKGVARGIRTYSAREGMEVVPDLAAKLGLKVIFGAWLTNDIEEKGRLINQQEVAELIKAANAHPNEIERVIVGNEVLLRRDLTPDKLIGFIRQVKAAVKQPVSYADVWAFYLKYPEVGKEVDYITIHILPFWEDEPSDIDHVEESVTRIVARMREAFPGKPILIGEAGWPSIGRDRGPAVVNTVNEARFVRQMANIAAKYDFDYNIVEAFDQPWKSALENTVGAAWGVMDIDRKPKFQMSGPVQEIQDWTLRAAIAIAAGLLATLWFGRGLKGFGRHLALAVIAQILSWLAVTTCFHAQAVNFRWWQEIWTPLRGGLGVLMALAAMSRARVLLQGESDAEQVFGRAVTAGRRWWNGEGLLLISGVYAIVWSLLLFIDGRYRDIPEIDFSVPCAAVLLLSPLRRVLTKRCDGVVGLFAPAPGGFSPRLCRLLGFGLLAGALLSVGSEALALAMGEDFNKYHPDLSDQVPLLIKGAFANREMVLWSAMQLVMAAPFLAALRRRKA